MRGYQVCRGIWEAKNYHTAVVMERYGPRLSFNIASAFFQSQHEGRLVPEDPVDPGHCQRDTVQRTLPW